MLLTQFLVVVLVRGCFFLVFVRSYCYCLVLFVVVCFARCPLSLVFVSELDLVLCSCGPVINLDIVSVCGPSTRSGQRPIGRATNRFDIVRSASMDAQPAIPGEDLMEPSGERGPTLHSTPYNYTHPSPTHGLNI